jgi:hypothetical protein
MMIAMTLSGIATPLVEVGFFGAVTLPHALLVMAL